MEKVEYEVGQKVWLHGGGSKGNPLTEGEVVHTFQLSWGDLQYVVQVETHIDPVLYVRDWLTLSDSATKPINFFRRP